LDIHLRHELVNNESILHISGEVDMATSPAFRDAALLAIVDHGPSLTIDLAGVTFMDSTGLHVLVGTYRRVRVHGGTFRLRNIPDIVRKLLRVTGLDEVLGSGSEPGVATLGATRVVDAATS
jgi:anti-sigma B factor antagonist